MKKILLTILLALPTAGLWAQSTVHVGKGGYAAYAPLAKSRTAEHGGDQSQYMQYRELYIREAAGQPIPTNDWWTDLINADHGRSGQEVTGHLWSYPQYVQGMRYGLDIHYPKYWVDNGTEMKAQSKLRLSCGEGFAPSHPMAEAWSDWTVTFSETSGTQQLLATLAHGMPFTWVELQGISPVITAVKTDNDGSDNLLTGAAAVTFTDADGNTLTSGTYSQMVVRISNASTEDLYGVYLPEGSTVTIAGGEATVSFSGERQFVVVALLKEASELTYYETYAYGKPTNTTVSWDYAQASGTLTTRWQVTATDLRTGSATTDVLQGFIPHHYRNGATPAFSFCGKQFRTPRGQLRLAEGSDLSVSYRFAGMLPWYAVPGGNETYGAHGANETHGTNKTQRAAGEYDPEKMTQMLETYAQKGEFGGDTYWGGKGLTQMALYMTFARELGEEALFKTCHDRLKEALVNWLTYTPGEDNFFFARDSRYGGLIDYNTSYDSDTYNDHHFHYGYFTLAAALLAMVDDANNALVGGGLSVVTLCYLHRALKFYRSIVATSQTAEFTLSREVLTWLKDTEAALSPSPQHPSPDAQSVMDALGEASTAYRQKIYAHSFSEGTVQVQRDSVLAFLDTALGPVAQSIRANRREDGLYHSYNIMELAGDRFAGIRTLSEMLEGQVAVLSSGVLSATEALAVLDALRTSKLWREDQQSYMLYPNKELPGFFEKNCLPKGALDRSPLLKKMVQEGDRRLVSQDACGASKRPSTTRPSPVAAAPSTPMRDWAASTGTWCPNCWWPHRSATSKPLMPRLPRRSHRPSTTTPSWKVRVSIRRPASTEPSRPMPTRIRRGARACASPV